MEIFSCYFIFKVWRSLLISANSFRRSDNLLTPISMRSWSDSSTNASASISCSWNTEEYLANIRRRKTRSTLLSSSPSPSSASLLYPLDASLLSKTLFWRFAGPFFRDFATAPSSSTLFPSLTLLWRCFEASLWCRLERRSWSGDFVLKK